MGVESTGPTERDRRGAEEGAKAKGGEHSCRARNAHQGCTIVRAVNHFALSYGHAHGRAGQGPINTSV